jgi:uncharacterized protein (TIGR00369 family)
VSTDSASEPHASEDFGPHEARFATLGLSPVGAKDGRSEIRWHPTPFTSNSRGHVHGGLVGSVIDDCSAMAVHSAIDGFVSTPTVSMHIDYLLPIFLGQDYLCRGSVLRIGGRLAVADTTIENSAGELCVRGTGTFVLFRGGG